MSIILLCIYQEGFSAYSYGSSVLLHPNVLIHVFRLLVHSAVSIFVIGISYRLYKMKFLLGLFEKIGKESMIIYIFHGYYLQTIVRRISNLIGIASRFSEYKFLFDYFVSFVVCVLMIFVCLLLDSFIKKSKVMSMLFLGIE